MNYSTLNRQQAGHFTRPNKTPNMDCFIAPNRNWIRCSSMTTGQFFRSTSMQMEQA
jgi:hypothetical protein